MWTFFERIRIVVTAVIFIILITAFLVFPAQVADVAESIEGQERYIRVLLVFGALLADIFLIYTIYREFSSARRYVKGLLVRSADANVQISLESVEENLNNAISKLDEIYEVETDATTDQRGRLRLKLDITASDRVDIATKTKDITREIERIVEKRMGLRVGTKPEIKFHLLDKAPAAPPSTESAERKSSFGGFFGRESKPEEIPAPPALKPEPTPLLPTNDEVIAVNSSSQPPEITTDENIDTKPE